MFTLAHLSDPHLPLPRPGLGSLGSKRVLGYLSWLRRRKAIHGPEVLASLVADVRKAAPDHVVVTGDLCNISLPEEFRRAADWLARLGPAAGVAVVPGNHDAYVAVDPALGLARWTPYLAGDGDEGTGAGFPWVRRRGGIALVGASSARPMSWISAGGWLGADQVAAIERRLEELGREGLFRVLLIHHPPLAAGPKRKRLRDIDAIAGAVARMGVELVLHGHTHTSTLGSLTTPRGRAPVLGIASASARAARHAEPARWNLIRVERAGAGWRVRVTVRGSVAGAFGDLGDYHLAVAGNA